MKRNPPTFTEQFDKITKAYFSDELDPMNPCACFIGNILNRTNQWAVLKAYCGQKGELPIASGLKDPEYSFYTMEEILAMERNFLKVSLKIHGKSMQVTETSLFRAVETTLDMLQSIHEAKGEVIGHIPVRRRQLVS
jgi:hypothetical protein